MITKIDVDLIKNYLENYPVRDVMLDGDSLNNLIIDGERLWHVHTPSDWIIDKEPTTATEGLKHKECTECGEIIETATIPVLEPLTFTLSEDGTYYFVAATDTYISGVIDIPSTYGEEDLPVTRIPDNAFEECSEITGVVIPDSITHVGNSAFDGCYRITSVYINDLSKWCKISFGYGVRSNPLGYADNLYVNGELVTELVIPDSIMTIGYCAFGGYSGLISVVIPDSVTSIGTYAFSGCHNLTSVMIGNNVKTIGSYAFYNCSSLTSVVIPNRVTSIGAQAFYNCTSLTSIVIPNSVTTIDVCAFEDCSSLASVTFEGGSKSKYRTVKRGVFKGCSSLTDIKLWYISTVESEAFMDCTSLTGIVLPNVESIGDYAFQNCSNLYSIAFGYNAQHIGKDILLECDSFNRIYFDGYQVDVNYTWDDFLEVAKIGEPNDVLLNATRLEYSQDEPDEDGKYWHYVNGVPTVWCNHTAVVVGGKDPTCTEDGLTAGSYCSKCGAILVEQQVIEAPGHKYSGIITPPTCMHAGRIDYTCTCGDISSSEFIPRTDHKLGTWYWSASDGEWRRDCQYEGCDYHIVANGYEHLFEFIMLSNGTYAIKAADGMAMTQVLEIPSTHNGIPVTKIADGGFKENIYLNEVIIPEGIEEIGSSAFFNCRMLGYDLVIPSSVLTIESNAFGQCDGIRNITFAESDGSITFTRIKSGAFSDCHGLEGLTISSSVYSIETGAFERCYGLKFLLVEEGNPRYHSENNCIVETYTNKVVLGCKNSTIPNIITTISSGAFNVMHQAPITIPLSVTVIESLAFSECEDLVVYVEAPSKPEGWADDWCDGSVTVVWGYTEDTSIYLITEDGAYLTDEQGRLLII